MKRKMRRWYEMRIREAVAAAGQEATAVVRAMAAVQERLEEREEVVRQEMTEAAATAAAAAVSAAEAAVAAAVMREEMVGVESELVVSELGRMREMRGRERIGQRLQNCREDGRQLREALRCRVEEGQRMEEEGAVMREALVESRVEVGAMRGEVEEAELQTWLRLRVKGKMTGRLARERWEGGLVREELGRLEEWCGRMRLEEEQWGGEELMEVECEGGEGRMGCGLGDAVMRRCGWRWRGLGRSVRWG